MTLYRPSGKPASSSSDVCRFCGTRNGTELSAVGSVCSDQDCQVFTQNVTFLWQNNMLFYTVKCFTGIQWSHKHTGVFEFLCRSTQSWPAVRLIRAVTRVEGLKMKSCVCPVYMVVTKPQSVWNRTLTICAWFASLRLCLLRRQSRYSRILSLRLMALRGYRITYIQEISM